MSPHDKPLVWLTEALKTPPFSADARIEAGFLLRRLQRGEKLSMPQLRPMPSIGAHCHELRIRDRNIIWRIFLRLDSDAVVISDVLNKKTRATPGQIIALCRSRFKRYDDDSKG
jgi:phage-related protein